MHKTLCDVYGIDAPIFAFSHSPAVVLAVTKVTLGNNLTRERGESILRA